MKYNSQGQLVLTAATGAGLYAPDGSTYFTDQTNNASFVGKYNSDGSLNVTVLNSEATWTGLYAKNGSLNVVAGAGRGIYSPCGALNVTGVDIYTPTNWAANVTSNGGTYSANTLAALAQFDADLIYFGYKSRMLRCNIQAGDNIQAGFTSYIWRSGTQYDVLRSGTLASWSEVNGLLNGTNGIVGTTLTGDKIDSDELSIGVYSLQNLAPSNVNVLGKSDGMGGLVIYYGVSTVDLSLLDGHSKRIQTDFSLGVHDGANMKGLIAASMKVSNPQGSIVRNGEVRRNNTTLTANAGANDSSAEFRINTSRVTAGGYFIGKNFTPQELMNLAWMWHDLNRAIGRGVVTDGVV